MTARGGWRPWAGVAVGVVAAALEICVALAPDPGVASLSSFVAAPLLAWGITRLAGPRATTALGISLLGASLGIAILSGRPLCAPIGSDTPPHPRIDELSLLGGMLLVVGLVSGAVGTLAARPRGPRFERLALGGGALVTTVILGVTVFATTTSPARPTRDAWFARLVDETHDHGMIDSRPYVVVLGERVTTDRPCFNEFRPVPVRSAAPLTSWRDPETDVYVIICDVVGYLAYQRFVAAYRRGPNTPAGLDPGHDRGGMRFAAPRTWQARALVGATVGCLWILIASLRRAASLRSLGVTTRSPAGDREAAWSGAEARLPPDPDDPRVAEVAARYTAEFLCAAALVVVTCLPVAVAW